MKTTKCAPKPVIVSLFFSPQTKKKLHIALVWFEQKTNLRNQSVEFYFSFLNFLSHSVSPLGWCWCLCDQQYHYHFTSMQFLFSFVSYAHSFTSFALLCFAFDFFFFFHSFCLKKCAYHFFFSFFGTHTCILLKTHTLTTHFDFRLQIKNKQQKMLHA